MIEAIRVSVEQRPRSEGKRRLTRARPLALVACFALTFTTTVFARGHGAKGASTKTPPASAVEASDDASDPKQAARQMARQALALMHESRWADAEALLSKAYGIVPAPTVAVLDGRALEQVGKPVEALAMYEKAKTPPPGEAPEAFREAADDAASRIEHLRPKVPSISLVFEGRAADSPGLAVSLDGEPLDRSKWNDPILVDPGEHAIVATIADGVTVEDHEVLAPSDAKRAVLHFPSELPKPAPVTPVPPPARPESKATGNGASSWGWGALAVGTVGLGTGIVSGAIMLDAKSSLDGQCASGCPESASSDLSRFRTARVVSAIGYGVAIVGIGTGGVLLLFVHPSRRDEARAPLGLSVSPGRLDVTGRF